MGIALRRKVAYTWCHQTHAHSFEPIVLNESLKCTKYTNTDISLR